MTKVKITIDDKKTIITISDSDDGTKDKDYKQLLQEETP